MTDTDGFLNSAFRQLRRPLRLTRWGMVAERVTRAFWPFWSILLLAVAALMLGLHETLPLEALWACVVVAAPGGVVALIRGGRKFHWPTPAEAQDRLDRTLPGRPIAALGDTQAIVADDAASEQVWQAHVARMAVQVSGAKPVEPDLRISERDPYALRYVAVLAFAMALLFGGPACGPGRRDGGRAGLRAKLGGLDRTAGLTRASRLFTSMISIGPRSRCPRQAGSLCGCMVRSAN